MQKRAHKLHRKSTKGQEHHPTDWTAFRAEEKKYKVKFKSPPLDDVLDLATLLEPGAVNDYSTKFFQVRDLETTNLAGERRAFVLQHLPGLVLLPSFLPPDSQRELIKASLRDYARLNETNLHAHYHIPPEGLWSLHEYGENGDPNQVIQPKCDDPTWSSTYQIDTPGPRRLVNNIAGSPSTFKEMQASPKLPTNPSPSAQPATATDLMYRLRWANLGYSYHWGTKAYDFSKPAVPFPENLRSLCKTIVGAIYWQDVWEEFPMDEWESGNRDWADWSQTYEPEAGIVNFYQPGDSLMGHVDKSELSATTPLVSISLGRPAIFLIGGLTRDVKPTALLVRSGDVIVMSGPKCRRAYHGIPRILEEEPMPAFLVDPTEDWHPYSRYIQNARININVRQVFPSGLECLRASTRASSNDVTFGDDSKVHSS